MEETKDKSPEGFLDEHEVEDWDDFEKFMTKKRKNAHRPAQTAFYPFPPQDEEEYQSTLVRTTCLPPFRTDKVQKRCFGLVFMVFFMVGITVIKYCNLIRSGVDALCSIFYKARAL